MRVARVAVRVLVLAGVLSSLSPALAFIQERTPDGSHRVRWNLAAVQPNISGGRMVYLINKRGSDDVTFSSLTPAVDAAFGSWNRANSSVIDSTRVTDPSTSPDGTKPNPTDQANAIFWDEQPHEQNPFGIPSLTFSATLRQIDAASGDILDADIVLNASQLRWAVRGDSNFTSLTGPVDVQSALTHAIGLFIGLNDVPTQGSVMNPVDYPGDVSRRSLTPDELAAALDVYPPSPDLPVTSISGQVTKSGSPVFGAYVVAYQNGVPVVGGISDMAGNYSIRRLPPGTYTVRVLTVKRPLGGGFFSTLDNNFLSQAYAGVATDPATPVVATSGTDTPGINFVVSAADTSDPWEPDNDHMSAHVIATDGIARQIHHTFPSGDQDWVKFTGTAGHVYRIDTSNLGAGASDSDTVITLFGPSLSQIAMNDDRDAKQKTRGSRIAFRAGASGDHFVQTVQKSSSVAGSGTAYDISVADLGAVSQPPVVSSVTPQMGSQGGGYQVTITGGNFVPGASVTFGGNAATEVDVVGPTQLFATVPSSSTAGAVAVTVTNPDGTPSSPLANGFTYIGDVTVSFTDTTLAALGTFPGSSKGVAWVDYDGDGDLDLDFTIDVANQLYRNERNGTFTNVSGSSGIVDGVFNPNSGTWGDFNNDGCPDFYLVNPPTASNILFRNNCDGTGTFTNVTTQAGVAGRPSGSGGRDAAWADFDNDGLLDLFVADDDATHTNQLFKNNGNGQFSDVTAGSGITSMGTTVNVNWGDFNGDGFPDLFLVRFGTQSDILYRNNKNGTFSDVTATSGLTDTAQGTDAVWGGLQRRRATRPVCRGSNGHQPPIPEHRQQFVHGRVNPSYPSERWEYIRVSPSSRPGGF